MPDTYGALSADDFTKVAAWWAKHWKAPVTCPVCKTAAWTTGTHVVQTPRWASDSFVTSSSTYPLLPVFCKSCSHVIFFNAVTMGIVPAVPPQQGPSPPALGWPILPPTAGG